MGEDTGHPPDNNELGSDLERGITAAAAGASVGTVSAIHEVQRRRDAAAVAKTMLDTTSKRRMPSTRQETDALLRAQATAARTSTGLTGKSGARGRLRGHLFEDLDMADYNARGLADGKIMVSRKDHRNAAYDASKVQHGKFKGAVQHKAGTASLDSAVAKMENVKEGSARKGIVRVPGDLTEQARKKARKRVRVEGSEITTSQLDSTLDNGLNALAKKGVKATEPVSPGRVAATSAVKSAATGAAIGAASDVSAVVRGDLNAIEFAKRRARDAGEATVASSVATVAGRVGKATSGGRAIAQGASRSAVVSVAVSSLGELPAVRRGEMSSREFAENRGVDAAEAAVATAAGAVATGAVLATATGGAAAASVGGLVTTAAAATAGSVAGMGTVGAAAATAIGGVSTVAAGPVIIGGAVVVGTGLLVSKGFGHVRRTVRRRQQLRRELDSASERTQLPPSNG